MVQLGFLPGEKPTKLGCGKYACAYLAHKADAVVKITKDTNDALTAWTLKNLPGGSPPWAIPVHGVYRLPEKTFAICTARADPLPEEWAGPIDIIYSYAEDEKLLAEDWEDAYRQIKKEIEYLEAEHGATPVEKESRKALELINECVLGFRKLGLAFEDHHENNFGMFGGRPVVIDLGTSLEDEKGRAYPNVKDIPHLPF